MHLTIDIGNTRVKWARFKERNQIDSGSFVFSHPNAISVLCSKYPEDDYSLSSVIELSGDLHALINKHGISSIDHHTKIPLENNYTTPETLGMDRICSAIGGKSCFPENPVLVIDVGTCIKFELVTADNVYQGGNISPGMNMRFSALNNYTSKLPELSPSKTAGPIGKSTEEALRLGVQQGMLFEIQAMIDTMKSLHPNLKTVGTGGDLSFFVNDLKTHIFADPLLVLRGINEIHLHNS